MKPGSKGRRILPVFFSALLFLAIPLEGGLASIPRDAPHSPTIRVLLKTEVPEVMLSGLSLELHSAQRTVRFDGESAWRLRCERGRIHVRMGSSQYSVSDPVTVSSGAGLRWEGRAVREKLRVYTSRKGRGCELVNELDLEDYLVGVVNGEFSSQWHEESISAQIIAARTYAFHQLKRARSRLSHYDVEAGTGDQVYAGAESEDLRARELVRRTRGQVLVARNGPGAPIKAFYHSTCGGITEGADRVFGERAPGIAGGVRCRYCTTSPRYRWSFEVPAAELATLLGFRIRDLKVTARWESGRARSLELRDVSGRLKRMPAAEFRHRIGAERLRSTAFEVTRLGSGVFRFEGRGNGHGVGMCQWGAKEMGEQGTHHVQILSHYYPASQIRRVW